LDKVLYNFVLLLEDTLAHHEEQNVNAFLDLDVVEILRVQQVVDDLVAVLGQVERALD
jgi:hypothetical protein